MSDNDLRWLETAGAVGAVGGVQSLRTDACLPPGYRMYGVSTGDLRPIAGPGRQEGRRTASATGRSYRDAARGRMLAVSEALERYALAAGDEAELPLAAAVDLGDLAVDLDRVPRCSARELRRTGCPLILPDKSRPIRWLPAVDLHTGADVMVPAVMAHLGLRPLPAERFWLQISTGAAAHTSFAAAVVNGVCEVIERDAVALTWLQRLRLPQLDHDCLCPEAQELLTWCDRHGVDTHLFDATTDLGIPTVYCVQTMREPGVADLAQAVAACTDVDVARAAMRAVLEVTGIRAGISGMAAPRRYADYDDVVHGAVAMGRRHRRPAFDFLLARDRPVSRPQTRTFSSDADQLAFLLRRLGEHGMPVYAVDLTRRELEAAGLVAVQVVIPDLQPMSLRPLAQYRAHPRLYQAPARMGLPVLAERQLNPFPQPMA